MISPNVAMMLMKSDIITTACVFGNPNLSGEDKCVMLKLMSDDALLCDLQKAFNDLYPIPYMVTNPPKTPLEQLQMLTVELFMRFQERIKK